MRRQRDNAKKKQQKRHALRRARQRFGIVPDLSEMVRKIQTKQAEFYGQSSNRVTLWKMEVAGQAAIVVYDRKRRSIVTMYPADKAPDNPEEALDENRDVEEGLGG